VSWLAGRLRAALGRHLFGLTADEIRYTFEDVRQEIRATRAELREELAALRRDLDRLAGKSPELSDTLEDRPS
jgi:transposase